MILIATCSWDATTDLVIEKLRRTNNDFFRLNIDKYDEFCWDFNPDGFSIEDRHGCCITSESFTSYYRRKPIFDPIDIPKCGCVENWCQCEMRELWNDFYRECEHREQTILVRCRDNTYGKLRMMLAAARYFYVPRWHFVHGKLPQEVRQGKWVVKTLTSTAIGKDKIFFVREIDVSKLDLSYPWFLQKKIKGEYEVTVVYANGQMTAYDTDRSFFDGEDVRLGDISRKTKWKPCELTESEKSAIRAFMDETGYRFGRFDFIRKDGELWFLEMNPNGQWAWLDPKDENGLISMIANAIKSEDAQHHQRVL